MTRLQDNDNPIRGLMTWSVNWDNGKDKNGQPYDWELVTRYGYLTGDETPTPDRPSVPAGFAISAQTADSVTLFWRLSSGPWPVLEYNLYRDSALIGTVSGPLFTDSDLAAGTTYAYQISATDTQGVASALSAVLNVSTEGDGGGDEAPAWQVDVSYQVGDPVTWQNAQYACIQAHTSNAGWTPGAAVTLWGRL